MIGEPTAIPLISWPYKEGSRITPDLVWSYYVHAENQRKILKQELMNCEKRLANQRLEINRLTKLQEAKGD